MPTLPSWPMVGLSCEPALPLIQNLQLSPCPWRDLLPMVRWGLTLFQDSVQNACWGVQAGGWRALFGTIPPRRMARHTERDIGDSTFRGLCNLACWRTGHMQAAKSLKVRQSQEGCWGSPIAPEMRTDTHLFINITYKVSTLCRAVPGPGTHP